MQKCNLAAVILAAGKGKRMKSDLPKVLHTLGGRPLIHWVVETAKKLIPGRMVVVTGFGGGLVRESLRHEDITFAVQAEQLGTAHALMQAANTLGSFDGYVMVLNGDVPLIKPETLKKFLDFTHGRKSKAAFLSTELDDPKGYGRVIRGANGEALSIIEESDATPEQQEIREVNGGIYLFDSEFLFETLPGISNDNGQKEYYITDIITIACNAGLDVAVFKLDDADQLRGVNRPEELERLNNLLVSRGEDENCRVL